MLSIHQRSVPETSLLKPYDAMPGCAADCFETEIPAAITLSSYVNAFFTSPLFQVERWILGWAIKKPSSDDDIRKLADGSGTGFSAWSVEQRNEHQLLLTVTNNSVRTWLMIEPAKDGKHATRLLFGSAVLPKEDTGEKGWIYKALAGFHIIYSQLLLWSAKRQLQAKL